MCWNKTSIFDAKRLKSLKTKARFEVQTDEPVGINFAQRAFNCIDMALSRKCGLLSLIRLRSNKAALACCS